MARAFEQWPIDFRERPAGPSSSPLVSFVIGNRGDERLPNLLSTLQSIAGQTGVSCECVVVEQDREPRIARSLPSWVRHVFTPVSDSAPYSRSWAFNVGAREARGRYLVFHDNDICAPARYAAELVEIFGRGFDAARLQRFVFYITPAQTQELFASSALPGGAPAAVVQNCEGHSVAVAREAYFALGGHDESFVGWGGEDNEFFDRLRTLRLHDAAYLPFIHLHHAPAPGKSAPTENIRHLERRLAIPAEERIAELREREIGISEGKA